MARRRRAPGGGRHPRDDPGADRAPLSAGPERAAARARAAAGESEKAVEYARAANRALDKAASKGVIHKNQAANRKSAIAAQAASLG